MKDEIESIMRCSWKKRILGEHDTAGFVQAQVTSEVIRNFHNEYGLLPKGSHPNQEFKQMMRSRISTSIEIERIKI